MKRGELCRMHKLPDLDNLQGTILPGAVVLGELLGQGGMGTVYRGRQTALNRDVCVKFLALELLEQRDFVKRFYREGQILSRLSNPHVVEVYCIASLNDVHRAPLHGDGVGGRTFFASGSSERAELASRLQNSCSDLQGSVCCSCCWICASRS